MSNMTFTQPRATLEETLEFANRVRQAGGGNPLDALMPAVPEDASQCLIAKNLNFNCQVTTLRPTPGGSPNTWVMIFNLVDTKVRDAIAAELDLEPFDNEYSTGWDLAGEWITDKSTPTCGLVLPPEIGEVASEFDEWYTAIGFEDDVDPDDPEELIERSVIRQAASQEEINRLREFWPYVEQSIRESYENATFVNEKGEIIL